MDYIEKWWNVLDGDHVGVLKLLKVVIYAFQLFLYSDIIFFMFLFKAPNKHPSFIYLCYFYYYFFIISFLT